MKFNFDLRGYVFLSGIDVLRQSFASAREALVRDIHRSRKAIAEHEEALARGEPWVGERDDEGNIIWDQAQVLDLDVEIAEDAAAALRKAFAISLYHHWERSALIWTGRTNENHDKLCLLVTAQGIPIDPKLGAVRDLVNLLKHSNEKWGTALQSSWSSMFRSSFRLGQVRTDWYDAVQITDQHMMEIFEIITASGPTARPNDSSSLAPGT